jgi:predicted outer membrane protein
MAQRIDQSVAAMLALGNHCEIQLGQLASQKSQNPQVKEFAQQMVQDHTKFLSQLQPFLPAGFADDLKSEGAATGARSPRTGAGAVRAEGAAETRPEGAAAARTADNPAADNQVAQNDPQRPRANQGRTEARQGEAGQQGDQARNPMLQIQKDAAQRALAMTKEILNEKQGSEFDKCYIGEQVMAHVHMLAKLEASQNHVSPEFQQIIRQGQQTTEQHLKHARTLAQQLEGERGAAVQPGQPTRTQPGAARPGAVPGAARPDAPPTAPRTAPRDE